MDATSGLLFNWEFVAGIIGIIVSLLLAYGSLRSDISKIKEQNDESKEEIGGLVKDHVREEREQAITNSYEHDKVDDKLNRILAKVEKLDK